MDWKDLGKKLAGLGLPLLGTALGGPMGGSVGALVATALGLETSEPAAVASAIDADTAATLVALRTLQENNRAELERLVITSGTAEIQAVNATMQAEASANDPWTRRWRPAWGYLSALAWAWCAGCIGWGVATNTAGEVISKLRDVPMEFWLIPMTILGVASYHRGMMQRAQAGDAKAVASQPSLLGRILAQARGEKP